MTGTNRIRRWRTALALIACAAASLATSSSFAAENWTAIETAAKAEGPVVVYTTLTPENWRIILSAFHARYPEIKVTPQRTGANSETFERYRAESASGARTADVLMATGADQWAALANHGQVLAFAPSDVAKLPDFAVHEGGDFTLSIDPQVIIYNKLLLTADQRPKGLKDLVAKIKKFPGLFKGKIGSYDPRVSPFSYQVYTTLLQHFGDAFWPLIDQLAPNLRFEQTAGVTLGKVQTGEYLVGFMLPRALLPQTLKGAQAQVLGIAFLDDGTPLLPRDMGVVKGGGSPDGGKLLVNFLLTPEGQIAIGKAGLTPYYPGISKDVPTHYDTIAPAGVDPKVGNAVFSYSSKVDADMKAFQARFDQAVKK